MQLVFFYLAALVQLLATEQYTIRRNDRQKLSLISPPPLSDKPLTNERAWRRRLHAIDPNPLVPTCPRERARTPARRQPTRQRTTTTGRRCSIFGRSPLHTRRPRARVPQRQTLCGHDGTPRNLPPSVVSVLFIISVIADTRAVRSAAPSRARTRSQQQQSVSRCVLHSLRGSHPPLTVYTKSQVRAPLGVRNPRKPEVSPSRRRLRRRVQV